MANFVKIPVNRGKFTQFPDFIKVSPQDAKKLSKFKWNLNYAGYAFTTSKGSGVTTSRSGGRVPVAAHVLVSARTEGGIGRYFSPRGVQTKLQVDHINRQRNDDRRENLRQVTKVQNTANRGVSINRLSPNTKSQKGQRFRQGVSTRDEQQFSKQLGLFKQLQGRKSTAGIAHPHKGHKITAAIRNRISLSKMGHASTQAKTIGVKKTGKALANLRIGAMKRRASSKRIIKS